MLPIKIVSIKGVRSKVDEKKKTKKKKTKRKQQFLYNPKDPNKSFDVYIDKDPTDTVPIRYKTLQNVKERSAN